jgi:hypothetical protein
LELNEIPPKIEAIEKDRLIIPWSWDSFPKIDVIRPGFDISAYLASEYLAIPYLGLKMQR